MPQAPLKPCMGAPGCATLTRTGRCPRHPRPSRDYDAHRPNASRRGYTSARWKRSRLQPLQRQPLCEHCLARGRVEPATQVDHKTPATPDQSLFWQPVNHQSLCASCHSRKTATENRGFGNRPR